MCALSAHFAKGQKLTHAHAHIKKHAGQEQPLHCTNYGWHAPTLEGHMSGGSSRSQAVAGGRRRLRCPFLAKNPSFEAPRKCTMGCDPSTYIFSCALCHESTFDNIFILTEKPVFLPESNGFVG